MDNVIEHIARHADIDTRRAMGFGPRKLVAPDLKLKYTSEYVEFNEFNECIARWIRLNNACVYVNSDVISWMVIGAGDLGSNRTYSFRRDDGRVTLYESLVMKYSRHPDFNEDGSLKNWRSL